MEAGQKSIGEAAWLMYRDALMRAGYASAYNLDFVHDFELYMNGDLVQEARHNFSVAAHNLVEDFEAGNLAGWRKARNYS